MKVITTYFNPCKYKSKIKNYTAFKECMKKSGAELITMELARDDSDFEIEGSVRFKGNSFMWQKENLIIKGMDLIDDDVFAWIDCDVIFEEKDWVKKTLNELERSDVVQLFDTVTLMDRRGAATKTFKSAIHEFMKNPNFSKGHPNQGHPGFAFAGKKKKVEFYMNNFVFSKDVIFCSSLTHDYWTIESWDIGNTLKKNIVMWCESKNIEFSFVDTRISHLWHGSWENRQYQKRMEIIRTHGHKIELKDGLYCCDDKETNECLEFFFRQRREDEIMLY